MKVLFTEVFSTQLEQQLEYLAIKGAIQSAHKIKSRVFSYIFDFLVIFPRATRFIEEKSIYEAIIPGTNYIMFYRLEEPDTLRILALFHGAQDRSDFVPEE